MIAIDLSPLVFAPRRGVARALLHLLEGLERAPRGSLAILGFAPVAEMVDLEHLASLSCLDRTQRVGPRGYDPRTYRRALREAVREAGADVLLSPWAAFPKTPVPVVAWIHEVPFARHGAMEGTVRTLRHRRALARAVERAAALVVPAEAVRADLVHLHGEAASKVHVVPHGFSPQRWRPAERAEAPDGLTALTSILSPSGSGTMSAHVGTGAPGDTPVSRHMDAPYALLVGTGRGAAGPWKKGVDVFLGAYADERLRGLTPVMIGSIPYESAGVIVLEEPTDAELLELIRGARLLVVPSRSEGFGYPMLEAFAAGVPVVASAAGALPEVSGGAARLVPPGDVDALAEAILRVHTDEDLRARLIKAGLRRAEEFPVEAMARGWLRVLTQAGGLPWHA